MERSELRKAFAQGAESSSESLHQQREPPGLPRTRQLEVPRRRQGARRCRFPKAISCINSAKTSPPEICLPVSWIVPPEHFSDHPSSPWYGAWYLSETFDILTQNPEVWKKTIFILCYDENDGYFDHVPPFVPPLPDRPKRERPQRELICRWNTSPRSRIGKSRKKKKTGTAAGAHRPGFSRAAGDRLAVEPRRLCLFAGF